MAQHIDLGERFEPLDHGYKELEIPSRLRARAEAEQAQPLERPTLFPTSDGRSVRRFQPSALSPRFAMEPNALHIWPRGNYMCIALPNAEGSFTVTLFLPNRSDGDAPSFANLDSPQKVREFFARDFADAVPLMPDYERDFAQNPTGLLGTLYLERWHIDGRALLVGDAAHAIVPFHGQGMNCGFEDAVELAELMEQFARRYLRACSPNSSNGANPMPMRSRRWRWKITSRCATASPMRISC